MRRTMRTVFTTARRPVRAAASLATRGALTAVVLIAMVAGLTLGSAVLFRPAGPEPRAVTPAGAIAAGQVPDGSLLRNIGRLQERLRERPQDADAWAALGLAHIEQARVSADPAGYPRAEAAFDRSMRARPADNEPALSGRAALAAARHDFTAALRLAEEALRINDRSARALAIRVDALVELGRYDQAHTAVQEADATQPGIPVFTRYAYVMELRGEPGRAREALELAAGSATDPGDIAFVQTQLGELAWNAGDHRTAGRHFDAALRAAPQDLAALDGSARVGEARGDHDGALRDRNDLVRRAPLPGYLASLGELYESRGMTAQAREQYTIIGTWDTLAKANGMAMDLDHALVDADHGDKAAALRAARAEWQRRCPGAKDCSVHVADALAWALHVNGQDKEALVYARQALRTGYRNALFHYHLGMIEKALGDRAAARRELAEALRLNPRFSVLHAPLARKALEELS